MVAAAGAQKESAFCHDFTQPVLDPYQTNQGSVGTDGGSSAGRMGSGIVPARRPLCSEVLNIGKPECIC
ncbi:unnamed protein product [Linum trigynum]